MERVARREGKTGNARAFFLSFLYWKDADFALNFFAFFICDDNHNRSVFADAALVDPEEQGFTSYRIRLRFYPGWKYDVPAFWNILIRKCKGGRFILKIFYLEVVRVNNAVLGWYTLEVFADADRKSRVGEDREQ